MKKALLLAAALIFASACAFAETNSATVQGFGGDVTVTIESQDGVISAVTAEGAGETPTVGGAAITALNEGTLAAFVGQDLAQADFGGIETVSGATVTSTAVISAALEAQRDATGAAAEKTPVADGTYTATVPSYSVTEQMTLSITFADGELSAIDVVTPGSTAPIFETVTEKFIPRLIDSQSLATDAVSGATVSSNAVKSAVSLAIAQAGGDPLEWYTPVAKSTETVTLEGYDVIVVGLGASGIASYISATEHGATAFGIETAAKIGGNSSNTAGSMGINPPSYVEANGGEKFVEEEDLIADWVDYTDGDAKESMIRLMVEESGEVMDWLKFDYGFQFGDLSAFFHPAGWRVWASYPDKDELFISAMETAKARNEKNDYMTELTAEALLTDTDGAVIGVRATCYDGTTYEIYGDSVVLATGGFIGNAEMCEEYIGGVWNTEAMTQCDGAGIRMAQEAVGAALYNPDVVPVSHIAQVANIIRTDELTADQKAVLTSMAIDNSFPVVSADGTAHNDEIGMFFAFDAWKAGPTYYVLYAQEDIDAIREKGLATANTPMFLAQGGTVEAGVPVSDIDAILDVGEAYGDVFRADSLEALAEQLGMENLIAEADSGAFERKEGAYVAIKGASYVYSTCGGLDIDEQMNVLREDGTPVENLYAVGTDSMGTLFASGKAYVTYGAAAHGWCWTSGKIAGENAAAKYAE